MAFEGLADKLQGTFKNLRGKGVLTEKDIDAAMREVKLALLEADVNFKVVKQFVADVKEKAMGQDVMKSLTPAQQVVKIVKDELVNMMGGANSKLTYSPSGFTVYMMVGLQGTGKTTTCGKLANYLKQNGKKPMLCACDVYRPAAIDQLEVVGKAVNTPVFTMRESNDPVQIAKAGMEEAERKGCNILIVDTAGLLQQSSYCIGWLSTVGKPLLSLLCIDDDFCRILQRIVCSDFLDESTISWCAGICNYNSVERLLVCSHSLQSNLYHFVLLCFKKIFVNK